MASEIADLLNIALKTGITQKELHKEVVAAVTQAYLLWMHKDADPDIEINVDFLLGRVSIFKNSNDITPKDFTDVAEKTLREILIKIINKRLDIVLLNHNKSLTKQNPATDTLDYLKQYIFWALNVGYLLIMIGFILLFISKDWGATLNNILPNITFIHGARIGLLVITPILSLYLAIAHNPMHNANKLIQILVKFEVPHLPKRQ